MGARSPWEVSPVRTILYLLGFSFLMAVLMLTAGVCALAVDLAGTLAGR